jgi:alpha-D-xyloside xylohydrolase
VDSSEPDHYQGGEDWERTNDFIVLNKGDEDNATLNPHSLEASHTWRSMRNVFPLMHASGVYDGHRAQKAELTEAKRVMIMTRSGFIGMQRYGAGTWSGDITASWATLANQIPAALNYSACGIPSWNSDIGGFFNCIADGFSSGHSVPSCVAMVRAPTVPYISMARKGRATTM